MQWLYLQISSPGKESGTSSGNGTGRMRSFKPSFPFFTLCLPLPEWTVSGVWVQRLQSFATMGSLNLSFATARQIRVFSLHWIRLKPSGSNWRALYAITLAHGVKSEKIHQIDVELDTEVFTT